MFQGFRVGGEAATFARVVRETTCTADLWMIRVFAPMLLAVLAIIASPAKADEIVLRDATRVTGTVTSVNVDGVHFKNRPTIGWDNVDQGSVDVGLQAEFDRLRADLGLKLFRIRSRLQTEDYNDLSEHVEAIYPRYAGRRSKTAYMVFQGLMWSRLAKGKRGEALVAYFQCYECLRSNVDVAKALPGNRRLKWDAKTGMTLEIPPIWFDKEAAEAVLPKIKEAVSTVSNPPASAYVYFGTIALASGDEQTAKLFLNHKFLNTMATTSQAVRELQQIALAELKIKEGNQAAVIKDLKGSWQSFSKPNQALALYWLGQAGITSNTASLQNEGMLRLMYLPSLFGAEQPELAAAGLYNTMETMNRLKRDASARSCRRELMSNFSQTHFGRKIHADINQSTDEAPK